MVDEVVEDGVVVELAGVDQAEPEDVESVDGFGVLAVEPLSEEFFDFEVLEDFEDFDEVLEVAGFVTAESASLPPSVPVADVGVVLVELLSDPHPGAASFGDVVKSPSVSVETGFSSGFVFLDVFFDEDFFELDFVEAAAGAGFSSCDSCHMSSSEPLSCP